MPEPQIFHTIPLRDIVIFPQMTTTILVGREKSINSIEEAQRLGVPVLALTQTNPDRDEFSQQNIHHTGCLCSVVEAIRTADGTLKVILQGLIRARIKHTHITDKFFTCEADLVLEQKIPTDNNEILGLIKACIDSFTRCASYNKRLTPEILTSIHKLKAPHEVIYMIATYIGGTLASKQQVLEEDDIIKKFYKLLEILKSEIEIGQAEERINKSVQEKFTKHQKEAYLTEQMKNIRKELGQDEETEVKELKEKIGRLKLSKEVRKRCDSELNKLEKMNPYSSESGVVRNYLEWICALPWTKQSKLVSNLTHAKKILDKHHYGLEKVKERIIEFIAVQMKTKDSRGPILCLVGAPGVGKTSLAKSIAESLGRKYVKVSLGGVRDESEIRGHRRTYIGSMPGRIIQSMRKAEKINPMLLLDEIDKMSHDFRGDPAAALLEVLDPEQNDRFSDHYLEVDYNLSKVMFVATANSTSTIPVPLHDRMEIIRLSGYTENEKLHIAKEHLVPRQRKENGLHVNEFSITNEAILTLIRRYTFEAGVRNLSREIGNLTRKAAKVIVTKEAGELHITEKNLRKYAGIEKKHFGIARDRDLVGVTTGLAYTEYGGDLLDIEVLKFAGSGKIQITGRLGEVMKESAQAALSYTRSIAKELKVEAKSFNKLDFHIHVPEGATPKDGPSAGVALCISLISALTKKPVRRDVAMTGEITLTGKVLEIGGLKEKLLAALRGQIETVLIPKDNMKDLEEMPKEVLDNLTIKPIAHVREAIKECLRH
ncbi:MAG: endopeptidase La [Alphaproteobacteria bacterium]|nr:endopeptidase La [Alphaproteobacteria bacterium]